MWYFATALPGLQPTVRISNVITQMEAARSGAGLCILPCFMADRYPDLVRVLPGSLGIVRTCWLLAHVVDAPGPIPEEAPAPETGAVRPRGG